MEGSHYSFTQAALLCLPELDASYLRYEAEIQQSKDANRIKVTCSKGCGTCCHYGLISSSSIEAFGLFARLIGSGLSLQDLAAQCGKYVDKFKELTQSGGLVGHLPFSRKARLAFLKARLPCPFFVSTQANTSEGLGLYSGHCGVYSLRPMICSQFNSTEPPQKCLNIEKHQVSENQISAGTSAADDLRIFEQHHFGKSALGHLPLLVAAMTTQKGLDAFLRKDIRPENTEEDPHAAGTADFFFYVELLDAIGIQLQEADYLDLETAQAEDG